MTRSPTYSSRRVTAIVYSFTSSRLAPTLKTQVKCTLGKSSCGINNNGLDVEVDVSKTKSSKLKSVLNSRAGGLAVGRLLFLIR